MSELRIRVAKYVALDSPLDSPTVFGSVYRIERGTGHREKGFSARRVAIPISEDERHYVTLDLDPGRYVIEVAMPSGECLSDQADVTAHETMPVVLRPEASPHEWLSWQHLVGNLAAPVPQGRVNDPDRLFRRRSKHRFVWASPRPWPVAREGASADFFRPTVDLITAPTGRSEKGTRSLTWEDLLEHSSADAEGGPLARIGRVVNPGFEPAVRDAQQILFRLAEVRRPAVRDGLRAFAIVRSDGRTELISLAMPWQTLNGQDLAPTELVISKQGPPGSFLTSAAVQDPGLALLLGFLSAGALTTAREVAEHAREMLYYKMVNPLGAAAGGYALVGTVVDSEKQDWHQWVANLCERFPHIPDGAIQLSTLKLNTRRHRRDVQDAREYAVEAYRRGIPYYSLGVRWLSELLDRLSAIDADLIPMRDNVRRVSLRCHPQAAFTTIRLGR